MAHDPDTTATTGTSTAPRRRSARLAALARRAATPPSGRRVETQRLLLDSGRRLVAEHGVAATSVGMICAEADFSRGAFYSNFVDMDDFVAQVAADEWRGHLETVRATTHELADAALARTGEGTGGTGGTGGREGAAGAEGADGTGATSADAADPAARVAAVARLLHAAVAGDRETFLLWTSLSAHLVHSPDSTARLREAFAEFREGMAALVVELLERADLVASVDPLDIVDTVHSLAMRATMLTLLGEEQNEDDLLDRLLPVLAPAALAPDPSAPAPRT